MDYRIERSPTMEDDERRCATAVIDGAPPGEVCFPESGNEELDAFQLASMPVPVATYPGGTVFLLLTPPEATTVSVEGVTPAVEPVVPTIEVDDGGAGGHPFRVALVAVPEGPATMQQRGPGGEELGSITIENHPTL